MSKFVRERLAAAINKSDESEFKDLCFKYKHELQNAMSSDMWYAIVEKEFVHGLEILLDFGFDFMCKVKFNMYVFQFACQRGKIGIVKSLLRFNPLITKSILEMYKRPNEDGLDIALSCGNKDIVKLVIETGIFDLNKAGRYGNSRLFSAISNRNIGMAECLIECGADIKSLGKNGKIPCICEAAMKCPCLLPCILKHGGNVNETFDGKSLLMLALPFAAFADKETVQCLLNYGADIEFKDENGKTCFHYMQTTEQLYSFLDSGMQISTLESKHKFSTLHWLLSIRSSNKAETMLHLLENGADPNMKVENEDPLIIKAMKTQERSVGYTMVSQLVHCGADVKCVEVGGRNIIDVFLEVEKRGMWNRRGSPEVGALLIKFGASPDCNINDVIQNVTGDPVCEWSKFATVLLEKGTNPNGKYRIQGSTQIIPGMTCLCVDDSSLHYACRLEIQTQSVYCIDVLLKYGARIDLLKDGNTTCMDTLVCSLGSRLQRQINKLQYPEDIQVDCTPIERILKAGGDQFQVPGNEVLLTLIKHGLFTTAENVIRYGWFIDSNDDVIKELLMHSKVNPIDGIVLRDESVAMFGDFLKGVMSNPPSLKNSCRKIIRRQMSKASAGKSIYQKIKALPLPPAMQNFVGFADTIWAECEVITATRPMTLNQWRDHDSHYDDYDDYDRYNDDDDYDDYDRYNDYDEYGNKKQEMWWNASADEWEPAYW